MFLFPIIVVKEDRRKVNMDPNSQEISALRTEVDDDSRNAQRSWQ